MRTAKFAGLAAAALTLSLVSPGAALAGTPNGLKGYEGQPGHQAGQTAKMGPHTGLKVSKVCSPGQQGNPAPGFKPGGCKR